MSRFYGSMHGSAKTEATRCGTRASGISAHVRGWNIGLASNAHAQSTLADTGDVVEVRLTGGSNSHARGAIDFTAWEEGSGNMEFVIRIAGGYISGTFDSDGKLIRINQPERKL